VGASTAPIPPGRSGFTPGIWRSGMAATAASRFAGTACLGAAAVANDEREANDTTTTSVASPDRTTIDLRREPPSPVRVIGAKVTPQISGINCPRDESHDIHPVVAQGSFEADVDGWRTFDRDMDGDDRARLPPSACGPAPKVVRGPRPVRGLTPAGGRPLGGAVDSRTYVRYGPRHAI
jgi:hypothetical protein